MSNKFSGMEYAFDHIIAKLKYETWENTRERFGRCHNPKDIIDGSLIILLEKLKEEIEERENHE